MPSERVRNIAVGLTMLVALIVLCIGISMLGTFSTLAKGSPYEVTVLAENANGLSPDTKVDLNGVYIGSIKSVALDSDGHKVRIVLAIDHGVRIPGNVSVEIGRPTIGAPYITLLARDQPTTMPNVPDDGTALIKSAKSESGPIPQDVFDSVQRLSKSLQELSGKLALVSDDMHELLRQRPTAEVDNTDPNHPLANISTLVQRLDSTTHSIDKLVGDPKLQEQAKTLVANLSTASQDIKQIVHDARESGINANIAFKNLGDAGSKFSVAATQATNLVENANRQIIPVTEKLVDVLATLQKTLTAISDGKGTAGRFVQDPKLYEGLVDVTNELKGTIDDMHALVREIRENGVAIHLGGNGK
jgi:phospholipid/cholesterol/gamma-HCH transport system substrate-binding protein